VDLVTIFLSHVYIFVSTHFDIIINYL